MFHLCVGSVDEDVQGEHVSREHSSKSSPEFSGHKKKNCGQVKYTFFNPLSLALLIHRHLCLGHSWGNCECSYPWIKGKAKAMVEKGNLTWTNEGLMPLIRRSLIMKVHFPVDSLRGRRPFSLCLMTSYLRYLSNSNFYDFMRASCATIWVNENVTLYGNLYAFYRYSLPYLIVMFHKHLHTLHICFIYWHAWCTKLLYFYFAPFRSINHQL
jgi:hypothetical protein